MKHTGMGNKPFNEPPIFDGGSRAMVKLGMVPEHLDLRLVTVFCDEEELKIIVLLS